MHADQLKYLIEISKSPSLNSASEKLHISYQALSHSIKALEDELGVLLLKRTNKGSVLTPEGAELIELSTQFFNGVNRITHQHDSSLTGNIHFLTTVLCLEYFLTDIFCELYQRAPKLKLDYQMIYAQDVFAYLSTHLASHPELFALSFVNPSTQNTSHDLIYRPLFSAKIFCLCSPQHELAQYRSISMRQLKNYKFVTRDHAFLDPIFCDPQNSICQPNLILCNKLISTGVGFSLCLSLPFAPYHVPQIENTIKIELSDNISSCFGLIHHKDFVFTPEIIYFLQLVLQQMGLDLALLPLN